LGRLELLVRPAAVRIHVGSYTGDGAAERRIGGLPFRPVFLRIYRRDPGEDVVNPGFTDSHVCEAVEGVAAGLSRAEDTGNRFYTGRIIRFEDDGFVVGDRDLDKAPNKDGEEYVYIALGRP